MRIRSPAIAQAVGHTAETQYVNTHFKIGPALQLPSVDKYVDYICIYVYRLSRILIFGALAVSVQCAINVHASASPQQKALL
jgi:hypothetical protein